MVECFERYFYDVEAFTDEDRVDLFATLDAAEWVGQDGDDAESCQQVLDGVNYLYYGGGADLYTGMPDWEAQEAAGDSGLAIAGYLPHPDGPAVLFHSEILKYPAELLEQALHEAAHHAGIGHDDEFSSYDAQECAEITEEEEDDDPSDPGGGSDPEAPEQPCEAVWVPPVTETRTVRVPVGMDYEDCDGMVEDEELGWICGGATLVGRSYDDVEVEITIEPGYWTVCPGNES